MEGSTTDTFVVELDKTHVLKTLAYGSCNSQDQPLWQLIIANDSGGIY